MRLTLQRAPAAAFVRREMGRRDEHFFASRDQSLEAANFFGTAVARRAGEKYFVARPCKVVMRDLRLGASLGVPSRQARP